MSNNVDDCSWLEERNGASALAWVKEKNAYTDRVLRTSPEYASNHEAVQALNATRDDEDFLSTRSWHCDGWIYDCRVNDAHPRGILRRTRLQNLRSGLGTWERLLDIDALSKDEGKKYDFAVGLCNGSRALLLFWIDGSPVWREFDLGSKEFPKDGFTIYGRARPVWLNANTLLVGSGSVVDTERLSQEGALTVRKWVRGSRLEHAELQYKGTDSASLRAITPIEYADGAGNRRILVQEDYRDGSIKLLSYSSDGQVRPIFLPGGPRAYYRGMWLVQLNRPWGEGHEKFPAGSLIAIDDSKIESTAHHGQLVISPNPTESIERFTSGRDGVLVLSIKDVGGRLTRISRSGDHWENHEIDIGGASTVRLTLPSIRPDGDDHRFVVVEHFLQPPTFFEVTRDNTLQLLYSQGKLFDAGNLVTEQCKVVSNDGTVVPYFIVRPKDFKFHANAPTLVTAYGAAGVSLLPTYDGILGKLWLERGGVYVVANVRGGGEYGPAWHSAALTVNRGRQVEDLNAVIDDLFRKRVTSPRELGLTGFSHGGGLMAIMLNRYPTKIRAAVLENAVLDWIRNDLQNSIGASRRERGNPEIAEERAFLDGISPFQNIRSDQAICPLIVSTLDDEIVYPAMSRRYAARLEQLGRSFYYHEATEGGHLPYKTISQKADYSALKFSYLQRQLCAW